MTDPDPDTTHQPERRVAKRRQRRVPWAFKHERRSGFDRRAANPGGPLTQALRQLRDSRWALIGLLAAINALNVLDLVLTLQVLGGRVTEGNPVMRILIGNSPLLALLVKVAIVGAVSFEIWRQRRYRVVLAAAVLFLLVFVTLTVFELRLLILAPN